MAILTVTERGQITFRKDVLQHLGIGPGEKIEIDLLPNGKAALTAARSAGSIHALAGYLKHKTNGAVLSIDELNDAISSAANRATTAE